MDRRETICALATPRGSGALGIVRVSGPGALALLTKLSRRTRFAPRRMVAVRLRHPHTDEILDHVLACYMPGPRSYTGEDVVEVHGHGGLFNMERIVTVLVQMGARIASAGEFTRRAFLNGRMDLSQAEGVAQIIGARSERALRNAQAIVQGELGRRVRAVCDQIVALSAHLEAGIDFAEDTDFQLSTEVIDQMHQAAARSIERLAATYRQGGRLDGVWIALVGPVNVGKTSLFNRLLGSVRAIVSDIPGTTRDYLEAEISWQGQRMVLMDTPGQGDTMSGGTTPLPTGSLEQAGRDLAAPMIGRCDLVVSVVDLTASEPMRQIERRWDRPLVVAANKLDLIGPTARQELQRQLQREQGRLEAPVVATSALTGEGVDRLQEVLLSQLIEDGDEPETVQVALKRQSEALLRARQALCEGREALKQGMGPELIVEHSRQALEALGEITGDSYSEEILDAVFNTFCIGK